MLGGKGGKTARKKKSDINYLFAAGSNENRDTFSQKKNGQEGGRGENDGHRNNHPQKKEYGRGREQNLMVRYFGYRGESCLEEAARYNLTSGTMVAISDSVGRGILTVKEVWETTVSTFASCVCGNTAHATR